MIKKNRCLLSFIITWCIVLAGCADNGAVSQTRFLMGTAVDITVTDQNIDRASKLTAIQKAFARLEEIDDLMSSYKNTSDVSNVNNFADVRPIQVSIDTIKVIKRADEINKITGGAFDITVAPLVELWGFGPKGAVLKMPSGEDIAKTLKFVGMDKMKIDYAKRAVSFKISGAKIDLAGIATGYAVDSAIDILKDCGIKNAMINAGGDIFCIGRVSWGKKWRIGIQHPRIKNKLLNSVLIENKAITTSGDYERFFFWDKKRISHIIDPRTGRPVADTSASVSIIAPDCTTADAFATAIFVLGLEEGIKVLSRISSIEAMIAVGNGKDIKVYVTDGFQKK